MAKWLPKELYGAVQGQGTATASAPVAVAMVKATAAEEAIIGASLDYSMCFDNIDAFLAIQVLQLFGLPAGMVRALKVLYRQIVCLTRVGQATAPTFRAFLGILQGCAWSGVLLSGLMAAWVRATRAHLDKTTLKKIKVLPSIYLDDRNIVTENPKVMHDILLFSAWYDDLINMKLNEDKCQLYSSPALPPEQYEWILTEARRTRRPWSLGYALPARGTEGEGGKEEDDNEAVEKLQARYGKAIHIAREAHMLPHDIRCKALETCFGPQFAYGCEYELPSPKETRLLEKALEKTIWGTGRRARSLPILWTVVYEGHALMPKMYTALNCAKFIFVVARRCEEEVKEDFRATWHEMLDDKCHTPIYTMRKICKQQGWDWVHPFVIQAPLEDGDRTTNFEDREWGEISHHLREAGRYALGQQLANAKRWDMRGLEGGIDYKRTGKLLQDKNRSFLRRGYLRTILAGAVDTPSRMQAGSRLTEEQARCVHCGQGVVESAGHRY